MKKASNAHRVRKHALKNKLMKRDIEKQANEEGHWKTSEWKGALKTKLMTRDIEKQANEDYDIENNIKDSRGQKTRYGDKKIRGEYTIN